MSTKEIFSSVEWSSQGESTPLVDKVERRDVMGWALWKQSLGQCFGYKMLIGVNTCVMS